jgi:ABC-2 type transport system ATP-binding protein
VDFKKRVHDFGEMLEIEDKLALPVRKLSLGERMKCELMNALIHQPRVLFLDEPTIGLDVTAQQVIRDFLKKWNKEHGATVMLTSHAMTDVEDLCKRVLVIQHGSLYFDGELAQLVKRMSQEKRLTLSFRDPVKKKDMQTLGKVEIFDPVKVILRVPREEVQSVAAKALAEFPILDISIEDLPLEEVIRKVFSESRIPATI